MCLALPVQVVKLLEDKKARVNLGGVEKDISVVMLEHVDIGDYVILHAGFALTKLNKEEAEKTLTLFSSMMEEIGS